MASKRYIDDEIVGRRFGRLVVLFRQMQQRNKRRGWSWVCQCDCGKIYIVCAKSLIQKRQQSCGCLRHDWGVTQGRANTRHGGTNSRLYHIWNGMKSRCLCKTSKYYNRYGGRGIALCESWSNSYTAFRDWALSNGYREDLTLDRIDNDAGYYPSNCRWVTRQQQALNRRPRISKYTQDRDGVHSLAIRHGVNENTIYKRLRRGESLQDAVAPVHSGRKLRKD